MVFAIWNGTVSVIWNGYGLCDLRWFGKPVLNQLIERVNRSEPTNWNRLGCIFIKWTGLLKNGSCLVSNLVMVNLIICTPLLK
jgi:hypothetical protein